MNFMLSIFTLLLGASCLAFSSLSAPAVALPATLKPEPHQRDPYDWNARHEAVKRRNREVKPEYVMIGDSITHHWGGEPSGDSGKRGEDSWKKLFGPHRATTWASDSITWIMPITACRTGNWTAFPRRVVIVLLGTNNLGHRRDTPQACADNMAAFIRLVRRKCPSSRVLLLGILPRKEKDLEQPIIQTNKLLAKLHDGKAVFFANPGKALLSEDGASPRQDFMRDTVHPNGKGYEVLGRELGILLKRMDSAYRGGQDSR